MASRSLAPGLRRALCAAHPSSTSRSFSASISARASQDQKWPQRIPLGGYYETIIKKGTPKPADEEHKAPPASKNDVAPPEEKPANKTEKEKEKTPSPPPTKKKPGRKPKAQASSNPTPSGTPFASPPVPPTQTAEEKARLVFGSPEFKAQAEAERSAKRQAQSSYLAGVLVPPQPEEPDNCCMSGCVNCVWETYRDEMEDWSAKRDEAQRRIRDGAGTEPKVGLRSQGEIGKGVKVGETKIAKDLWNEEAFQNVPVGIREFMKFEKKLRATHERGDASRG